jgi:signal transduction histidine kinase
MSDLNHIYQLYRPQYIEKQIHSFIEVIYRNVFRIQKLTKDILDVTRIESHTLRLSKTRFNLKDVILNAIVDTKLRVRPECSNKEILEFKNRDKITGGSFQTYHF